MIAARQPAEPEIPQPRREFLPKDGSLWAAVVYWARYKSCWFGALSRIAAINGSVGLLLWAIDEMSGGRYPALLYIRANLPLTAFVAALIALAYAVGRLGVRLDPQEPFIQATPLVLIVLVIVAVTSTAGPAFVAIGESAVLVLLLLVLRLRHLQVNAYLVIKAVLIASALILLGGIGAGIATGQLLETRLSLAAAEEIMRLIVFLLGMAVYLIEERRYWWARPPTPMVIEQLQRACRRNDFAAISRWLGEGLVFSQSDQRLLAEVTLPNRLIVDGDVAGLPAGNGEFLLFRVRKGQLVEMGRYEGVGSRV